MQYFIRVLERASRPAINTFIRPADKIREKPGEQRLQTLMQMSWYADGKKH